MSDLLKINVNEHTEKKGGLTYLSWAWAWAEVLKVDPRADWKPMMFGSQEALLPYMAIGDTAMVGAQVTINGIKRDCLLPVMDNRNNAVKNPDARKISDAIMRCMTKAIAMHGLGLYIYAGEDLPEGEEQEDSLVPVLEASIEQAKQKRQGVMGAVLPAVEAYLETNVRVALNKLAEKVTALHKQGAYTSAFQAVEEQGLDNEEKTYLWSLLDSGVRNKLKREKEEASMRATVAKSTTGATNGV